MLLEPAASRQARRRRNSPRGPRARGSARPASNHSRVNERARAMESRLQWPMLVAALLVVPAIAIEQSEAGEPWNTIAAVINWATWLAFLAEAVLMLRVVDD